MKTPGPNFFLDPLSLYLTISLKFSSFHQKDFPNEKKKFYSEQNRKKVTKNFTWFSMFQSLNKKKKIKRHFVVPKKVQKRTTPIQFRARHTTHGTLISVHTAKNAILSSPTTIMFFQRMYESSIIAEWKFKKRQKVRFTISFFVLCK